MSKSLLPDIERLAYTVPGVIYRIDLAAGDKEKVVFLNSKIEEISGYPAEEFLSGKIIWVDLILEADKESVRKVIIPNPEQPFFSIEYQIKDRQGKLRWILNRGSTIWENDKPKWRDGIILDITESKTIELELASQKKELNNLVTSLDDLVLVIDANGYFKNYFTKEKQILNLHPSEILNKSIAEAFASLPGYATLFEETYRKTVNKKKSHEFESFFQNQQMRRWLRTKFINLQDSGNISVLISDITREKMAEIALKQNEQVLLWASETARIGGWEINLEKRTIKWSDEINKIRELEKSTELSLDEAVNFYSPEAQPIIKKAIDESIRKGISWDLELPLITAKGKKKWIRDVGIPEMKNGKCVALRGVLQDIDEKKNAEIALQLREQQLELALRGANLGTWDWNIKNNHASYDRQWISMLGYSHEEPGRDFSTWEKLIHPDDMEFVMETIQEHLDGKTDFFEAEYRLKHKNGHWIWVMDRGKVVAHDADGKPTRASGTYLEITDRKNIELQNLNLQMELEEFKTAVNTATIVSIANLKGEIIYANKKFEEISLFSSAELTGQNHRIINSGFHPKSFWKNMWQTIRGGKIWRADVKNKRKDGSFYWVDTFIMPLRDSENNIKEYLSIRNDITEKKENEDKLQLALEKARESDRLKSAFLANISHEIRTPMTGIMGFAELLERPHLPDQKRVEFSRLINDRSKDLLNVVNDILDISRIEAGQITPVQVEGSLNELFDRLKMTFHSEIFHLRKKNILIQTLNELKDDENLILTDFIRLNQILNNLLSNACKFTSQGIIELGCRFQNPGMLLFWVKDTGMGIDPSQFENIFKPFRQADSTIHQRFGGSGLGLAISKGLVTVLNGQIWVESKIGTGSIFYFTIPYVPVKK